MSAPIFRLESSNTASVIISGVTLRRSNDAELSENSSEPIVARMRRISGWNSTTVESAR